MVIVNVQKNLPAVHLLTPVEREGWGLPRGQSWVDSLPRGLHCVERTVMADIRSWSW